METLFGNVSIHIHYFKKMYNIDISECFLACASVQLSAQFVQSTGLTFGKNVCMAWELDHLFYYSKGEISKLPFKVYINHNWNPIIICWKSKSGRVYDINDNDVDCNDIEFWFEGLDPLLYHKQLYPNEQLPFKLKGLGYELVVVRLNMDATLLFTFKEDAIPMIEEWVKKIDSYIQKFIDHPIKMGKDGGGVVHNFKRKAVAPNQWEYDVDTGSAGAFFYKKLLPLLSKLNCLVKVEIM